MVCAHNRARAAVVVVHREPAGMTSTKYMHIFAIIVGVTIGFSVPVDTILAHVEVFIDNALGLDACAIGALPVAKLLLTAPLLLILYYVNFRL
jgi:hypothetical protein